MFFIMNTNQQKEKRFNRYVVVADNDEVESESSLLTYRIH